MNKHLFKSLQEDKRIELNKLYNKFHRLSEFDTCIRKRQEYNKLTLTQYNCFWSYYYHTDYTVEQAYKLTFEED